MSLEFYIVDVFAEEKLQGNQLAVFRDRGVSSGLMQRIAKEMNFSETTFITSVDDVDNVYGVRIFTPESELPFAGHPTLGTAYVIKQELVKEKVDRVTLDMKVGPIPVDFTYKGDDPDILWMTQKPPVFGEEHPKNKFAEFLGLEQEDIDPEYPIQEVSTGVYFYMIPLASREALEKVKIDWENLNKYSEGTKAKWPHMFCRETENPDNHLKARMLTTFTEDPATGSANGCLAGYLVKHRYFDSPEIDVRVEQGAEVGRPSLLYLKANQKDPDIEVKVGGKCAMVARGEFL
ncbi:PhzF family phenazine biosynthesis isomerase [Candidatus Bathyarchaeota archaeon]|nr:PhzF family phenazine biosynthesis isomerase [Candidatus Bathyarchaeota archaeon]